MAFEGPESNAQIHAARSINSKLKIQHCEDKNMGECFPGHAALFLPDKTGCALEGCKIESVSACLQGSPYFHPACPDGRRFTAWRIMTNASAGKRMAEGTAVRVRC
jgi:hypothetical protein